MGPLAFNSSRVKGMDTIMLVLKMQLERPLSYMNFQSYLKMSWKVKILLFKGFKSTTKLFSLLP